jgi:hypothetical protein
MKTAYGPGLSLLLLTATMHCLTTSHAKYMEDYSSARREFDTRTPEGAFRISEGRVKRNGEKWEARFAGILDGRNRFLGVEATGNSLRLFESAIDMPDGDTAYILQQNACCLEDPAFRTILFSKTGERLAVADLLKQQFKYDARPAKALAVVDLTTTYNVTGYLLCWEDSDRLACKGSLGPEPYETAMKHIQWDVRSRVLYVAMHGWYLVTLPVDIITSPLQAAAVLLTPMGVR